LHPRATGREAVVTGLETRKGRALNPNPLDLADAGVVVASVVLARGNFGTGKVSRAIYNNDLRGGNAGKQQTGWRKHGNRKTQVGRRAIYILALMAAAGTATLEIRKALKPGSEKKFQGDEASSAPKGGPPLASQQGAPVKTAGVRNAVVSRPENAVKYVQVTDVLANLVLALHNAHKEFMAAPQEAAKEATIQQLRRKTERLKALLTKLRLESRLQGLKLKSIMGDTEYQRFEEEVNSCTELLNRKGGEMEELFDRGSSKIENLARPVEAALSKVTEVAEDVDKY